MLPKVSGWSIQKQLDFQSPMLALSCVLVNYQGTRYQVFSLPVCLSVCVLSVHNQRRAAPDLVLGPADVLPFLLLL